MKGKIHHIIKKNTLRAIKHIKKHKHHYMLGIFGSFAIIKTIGLLVGLFGFLTIKNTFAGYDDGLIAYRPLDINTNDYSINSNNGSGFNIESSIGKVKNGYDFNGSNTYINIPNNETFNTPNALTIQAWIKRDSNPGSGAKWASIVNKGGDNQYRLQHNSTNTGFEFAIRTVSGTAFVSSTTIPQQGIWYFLVGTYDGTTIKMYVNGTLERSIGRTSPITTTTSPVNIGRRATINDRYFDGSIDEVAIWNRALSSVEISGLYNGGAGLSLAPVTTYTLNYSSDTNGTISGTASQTINEGENGTTVTAIANTGYHFLQWNDGSTQNPRTDTNVTGNISVTAQFAINPITTYTLNYSSDTNGTISGTASQTINEGENGTTVTAIANSGYHFTQRSDGSTQNPRTDTNVTGNISVSATFALNPINTYTLTYTANSNGTISGTASQTINEGENGNTITAIANAGYHFTQRSDSSTQNPRTDTNVTGNITVTAQFAIDSSTTYDNGLIVYLPFDSDMYDYSSNNNHGVGVGDISSIGGKVGGAYDFGGGEKYVSVADNQTLKMIGSSYTLSAWIYMTSEQSEAGIVSKGNYPSSGPGYGFMIIGTNPAGISGNPPGNWFNSSYSVPISDWRLITVTFDASTNNHAIYVNGSLDTETVNGGRVPLDDDADLWIGNWREGDYDFEGYIDEVAIWNRALSSNEISGLYNNGNGISLLDDAPITYTLSYTTDGNGTISGTASQTINEGENGTTVTAIPNSGYHFLQWSDGSTNNPRTDTNVTGNISVTAQFLAEKKETNGGGQKSIIKDNCPTGDNSISYYDNICDMKSITGANTHGTAPIKSSTKTITRKTLARLLVFFSEEVLHIQLKENNTCTFEDIRNESINDQLIIKKSCQLGLMGLQKDGLTVDHKFRGNDTVMYEEFITTISRLLYDKKNNISLNVVTDGFINHIKALDNDNILVEIPERITLSVVVNILKKIYKNPNMIKK